jgi:hypothetical protein
MASGCGHGPVALAPSAWARERRTFVERHDEIEVAHKGASCSRRETIAIAQCTPFANGVVHLEWREMPPHPITCRSRAAKIPSGCNCGETKRHGVSGVARSACGERERLRQTPVLRELIRSVRGSVHATALFNPRRTVQNWLEYISCQRSAGSHRRKLHGHQ